MFVMVVVMVRTDGRVGCGSGPGGIRNTFTPLHRGGVVSVGMRFVALILIHFVLY